VSDAVDRATLLALETMDPAYFWLTNRLLMNRGLDSLAVTYCGEGAVTAVMTAARALGASRAQVLAHINSGDVVSERTYNHVVGYAAAVFLTGARPRAAAPFTPAQRKELLELSRRSISAYLKGGRMPAVPLNADPRLDLPGAAFVTLSKADGTLRGCIGSLEAQESVAESVAHNAVAAAVQDPRFKPVTASELPGLRVEISMLTRPVAVKNASEIKAGDGVTVERDGRSGVFLPQVWEQLGKRDEFLSELCAQKAKLERDCWKDPKTALKVFSAEVFRE
jgi:AmmeMemoRadiSam system protein A